MDSIQISIVTTQEGIEPLCARLRDQGHEQVEIVDDMASIRAYLQANTAYWDYVDEEELAKNGGETCVRFYVADDAGGREQVDTLRREMKALAQEDFGLDMGSLVVWSETIREEDWANNWRQFYKPIEIGEKLTVVPAWEKAPDNGRIPLVLEPGLVFGTGEHQTTQLCLAALEKQIQTGDEVLDVGSGSGILSITALLLGAKHVAAVDVDANAKSITHENAALNALAEDRYRVLIGDVLTEKALQEEIGQKQYDVVVANIVADVIIALIPHAKRWMKPQGLFISSGIIDDRLDDVKTAMAENEMIIDSIDEKEGWACICAHRAEA